MSSSSKNKYKLIRILFFDLFLLATENPIKRELSFYIKELFCNL